MEVAAPFLLTVFFVIADLMIIWFISVAINRVPFPRASVVVQTKLHCRLVNPSNVTQTFNTYARWQMLASMGSCHAWPDRTEQRRVFVTLSC